MTLEKVFILLCLLSFSSVYAVEGFPGREKYPDVPYISLDDLYTGYMNDEYTIIDTRSQFEYNIIKINKAINVPLSQDNFFDNITAVAGKTRKTIVFYCNGRRCMKSYKAAIESQLSNALVFDAGVFEWTIKYPEEATLLNKTPVDPSLLISKSDFKKHFVSLQKFESLIKDSILLDVRDLNQRRGTGLFLLADKSVPLDKTKKLNRYLNRAVKENKRLLAYDQAGKQVRWLQYYLEEKGIKEYYFMDGGAKYYTYNE
ncbi:MAG: rhodanese-like domain-containing protein [Gammaproteobacteria bacterium]|nr:rhodanese-like domain-containing protein [Gammaproteobacteria bacterium]